MVKKSLLNAMIAFSDITGRSRDAETLELLGDRIKVAPASGSGGGGHALVTQDVAIPLTCPEASRRKVGTL
jgi:hypothetical protein